MKVIIKDNDVDELQERIIIEPIAPIIKLKRVGKGLYELDFK